MVLACSLPRELIEGKPWPHIELIEAPPRPPRGEQSSRSGQRLVLGEVWASPALRFSAICNDLGTPSLDQYKCRNMREQTWELPRPAMEEAWETGACSSPHRFSR
jgi:hypothetical protein